MLPVVKKNKGVRIFLLATVPLSAVRLTVSKRENSSGIKNALLLSRYACSNLARVKVHGDVKGKHEHWLTLELRFVRRFSLFSLSYKKLLIEGVQAALCEKDFP